MGLDSGTPAVWVLMNTLLQPPLFLLRVHRRAGCMTSRKPSPTEHVVGRHPGNTSAVSFVTWLIFIFNLQEEKKNPVNWKLRVYHSPKLQHRDRCLTFMCFRMVSVSSITICRTMTERSERHACVSEDTRPILVTLESKEGVQSFVILSNQFKIHIAQG